MRSHPLDFVQVTYNAVDREVETRILPLARERGIAVIVNRPFRQRALIDATRSTGLPSFAAEIGCGSWAALLLKFVVSHPSVTQRRVPMDGRIQDAIGLPLIALLALSLRSASALRRALRPSVR